MVNVNSINLGQKQDNTDDNGITNTTDNDLMKSKPREWKENCENSKESFHFGHTVIFLAKRYCIFSKDKIKSNGFDVVLVN